VGVFDYWNYWASKFEKSTKKQKNFLAKYLGTSRKMFQISVLISKPFEKVQIRDKKVYGNYEVSLLTFMFPKLNNFFATFGRFSNKHRILLFRSSIYPRFFKVGILQTLKVQK
jgi:hypothetical protein